MGASISNRKIVTIVFISFLLLFSARFLWMHYYHTADTATVNDGVLHFNPAQAGKAKRLDGEWFFFADEYVEPEEIELHQDEKALIPISEDWRSESFRTNRDSYGRGTYYLQIQLPENDSHHTALYFTKIYSAAQFYVNGELISTYGNWDDPTNPKGDIGPHLVTITSNDNPIDLVIHVANTENPLNGGIVSDILFGTALQVNQSVQTFENFQMIVSIMYLIHVLYICFFLFLGRGQYDKELVYFAILLFLHAITIVIDDHMPLYLSLSQPHYQKLLLVLFISVNFSLLIFIAHLFQTKTRIYHWIRYFYIGLVIAIIMVPITYIIGIGYLILFFYLLTFYFIFRYTIQTIRRNHPDAIYVLFFIIAYTSNMLWGTLLFLNIISMPFYPFDFILTVIALVVLILRKYIRVTALTEKQAIELKAADKSKDEFLTNAAHELKNPLHGMMNIATSTLLYEKQALNEQTIENLELIQQIGKQMNVMVHDILDAQQIRYDQLQLFNRPLDIDRVIGSVWQMVSFLANHKDLRFKLSIEADFDPVWADENRLTQILFNILHNAIKYTDEGVISVNVSKDDNPLMAKIAITDQGKGIPAQQLENIFKRYDLNRNADEPSEGGLGIGLYIAKLLVDMQGGNIKVDSVVGQGSTFTFTLPFATAAQLAQAKPNKIMTEEALPPIKSTEGKTKEENAIREEDRPLILAVDDDPVNLKILKDLLQSKYDVTTTLYPEEVLTLLHKKPWDLIIMDVMMPKMSGYQLTEEIRKKFHIHELPILLLTAQNQLDSIHTGFLAGANDYVAKPMDAIELLARVHALTEVKHSTFEQLRMEAAWLQAQIEPHFLFNILNSIAALSEIDTQRMISLLNKFGTYLQSSFHVKNTRMLIPLEEELTLVEAYTYIEKERFGQRLAIQWDVEDGLNFSVPPLSIQPIVENAIRHGVLKKPNGGSVRISVKATPTAYQIEVADDGVGMSEETIQQLLDPNELHSFGVGVTNTNRRLIKIFGTPLTITSEIGKGTRVSWEVPIQEH